MTSTFLRCILPLTALMALQSWGAEVPSPRRPITVEDLWAMDRVGEPVVSPDGRWVVFTVTRVSMETNKSNSDLWLVPADGSSPPRRLTFNEGADGSPAWSPDGKSIAFVSKRGETSPQLYLLPMDGGEAEALTDLPVSPGAPQWFPDGRRLGFLASTWPDVNDDFAELKKRLDAAKDDKVQAKISETRLLRFWDQYKTDGSVAHLFVLDLPSRKVRDLMPGSKRILDFQDLGTWDVAPNGLEVAFSANATDPPYSKVQSDVFTLALSADGTPGELKNLTMSNPADDAGPRYSSDGRYLFFYRTRRPEVDPDFSKLARYDRRSGEIKTLTEAWDAQPTGCTSTKDGQSLYCHAEERGRVHVFKLPIAGGQPEKVVAGGTTAGLSLIEQSKSPGLVFRRDSLLAPAELFVLLPGTKEPRALTSFNAARWAELDLGSTAEETISGAGGDPVHVLLVYPPDFDRAKKWPLLHSIHGGPHGASLDQFHYRWSSALMASRGYVVALVNFHGSTGYGQAFAESIVGAHGDMPFTDVMSATDALIAKGFVDESRMAAAGGSYGGYLVSWILGHTNRFAALVDHAGVYDLMAQFASDATWGRSNNYGGSPWAEPEFVDRWSPSRFAASFATPTLILHGEKDYRVPYTQGVNLYGVLQGKGVPSRIVIFPDENHWILKAQSARLWWQEVFGWLERYAPPGGR